MKVVEIFNSIDGEGRRAGELTTFIRLYGCNLRCSYCDTTYSYDKDSEYTEMSIDEIVEECSKYYTKNITVTGGEPLVHSDIQWLLTALSEYEFDVNVETNGSVDISSYFIEHNNGEWVQNEKYKNVWFTIDYKCPTSNMMNKMCMSNFTNSYLNTVYKFVVGSKEDLLAAYEIIKNHIYRNKHILLGNSVYLSPVFGQIEPKEIVEFMQDKHLYNESVPIKVQLQLHKFIWDVNQKGV